MVPVPPGQLQYHLTKEQLLGLDTEQYTDSTPEWTLDFHTQENINRLTPYTKTGKLNYPYWKLILLLKRNQGENITLKGVLYHTQLYTYTLLTSINKPEQDSYNYRLISSYDEEYKICQCKMIAPLLFWSELKNRLV
jgi:hypothetical protein